MIQKRSISFFDKAYRHCVVSKFFKKGWGGDGLDLLFKLKGSNNPRDRKLVHQLVDKDTQITLSHTSIQDKFSTFEGSFRSPFADLAGDVLPPECRIVKFMVVSPTKPRFKHLKPLCIQYGGTGDHYYTRRHQLQAIPLAVKSGISSIILENPFYGVRKPEQQFRSGLLHVSDLFLMGACLILESVVLLNWAERHGFGPLGLSGISMGGHMSSLAAGAWPKPVSLVPCLSSISASTTFTQCVMSKAMKWPVLANEFIDPSFDRTRYISLATHNEMFERNADFLIGEQQLLESIGNYSVNYLDETASNDQQRVNALNNIIRRMLYVTRNSMSSSKTYPVVKFMRLMMDEFTHLSNYATVVDPSLVIAVGAKVDAYIDFDSFTQLSNLWPDAEMRIIDRGGHIASYLKHQGLFRKAIVDSLQRNVEKYHYNDLVQDDFKYFRQN